MRLALFALSLFIGLDSMLRAADGPPLFSDDFATLRPGWGQADDAKSVSGDRLLLNLKPDSAGDHVYAEGVFDNADIRVKVTEIKGEADQPAGIIFWAGDGGECYTALLQADGVVYVARRMKGKWITPVPWIDPIPSKIREAVRKGVGQENELRVVTSGTTAVIYVNGQEITRFRGFPPADGGKIGLHGESGDEPATWAFSDLRVFPGPVPAVAPTPSDDSLLFADDFDDTVNVDGHKLILMPKLKMSTMVLYEGSLFDDADIRATFAQSQGEDDHPVGFAFWGVDNLNAYVVGVQSDGSFGVFRKLKGKLLSTVAWQSSEAVNKGVGKTNDLRVVTKGNAATVYINDKEVASFRGFPPSGGGQIGFWVVGGNEQRNRWECSSFSVRKAP